MQTWIIYAIISMIFAGLTSVVAKYDLQNISADFDLGIRTTVICFNHYNHHLIRAKYIVC
jgi:transporter family protein